MKGLIPYRDDVDYLKRLYYDEHKVKFIPYQMRQAQTYWKIESLDQKCGGRVFWNTGYRLKHLFSGRYLRVEMRTKKEKFGLRLSSISDD